MTHPHMVTRSAQAFWQEEKTLKGEKKYIALKKLNELDALKKHGKFGPYNVPWYNEIFKTS